jgi:tripartite-type tricarboxylate transporter receptor subunit TctC
MTFRIAPPTAPLFMKSAGGLLHRLCRALGVAGLLGAASLAHADSAYPGTNTIRIVVPFGPGGIGDVTARIIGKEMNRRFGDNVIIDNRPGSGGIAAASAVLSAPRDGYTLAFFANGTAISESLFKLPYDLEKDFAPVSRIVNFDLLLFSKAGGPIKTLADANVVAKQHQLTFGAINPGSTQNLSAQLFKSTSKMRAEVVPYRTTGDVISGLVRGDLDIGFDGYAGIKGAIDGKQVQPIATTSATRSAWLPNVPTVKEAGVSGYEVTGWNALYVRSGTPQPIVDTLNKQLREVLASADLRTQLRALGLEPMVSTPAEMAAIFRADAAKWQAVIQREGIKPQ